MTGNDVQTIPKNNEPHSAGRWRYDRHFSPQTFFWPLNAGEAWTALYLGELERNEKGLQKKKGTKTHIWRGRLAL